MKLSREEMQKAMSWWCQAWNDHDINVVMELFHEDVLFEHWTGTRVVGWDALRDAWMPWFTDHGGFHFTDEDLFIDEEGQKVLYQWQLDWPSNEKGSMGKPESRRGVDVIHFQDGKIIRKLTYIKTLIEIDGNRIRLAAKTG